MVRPKWCADICDRLLGTCRLSAESCGQEFCDGYEDFGAKWIPACYVKLSLLLCST